MVASLGVSACGGPKELVIQGNMTGLPDSAKIQLYNIDTEQDLDSTWAIGGCFQLRGILTEEPQSIWLSVSAPSASKTFVLWLGNERVKIEGDFADFPYRMAVSGSKYQDQKQVFDALTVQYDRERDSLVLSVIDVLDDPQHEQEVKKVSQRVSVIDQAVQKIQEEYLFAHTNTYPGLSYLKFNLYAYPKDTVQMLFDRMSEELQACSWAKPIRTYLETDRVSMDGPFFDFEAEDQNGNRVRLSDFVGKDGKYLLLDFTSAGCGPCIQANKEMRQMVDTFSDSLQIVSFSMDHSRETWQKALQRDSICWTSLWSAENADRGTVSIPYRVRAVPTFFVIDPQGTIIHRWGGYGKGIFDKEIGWLKNKQ